MRFAMLVSGLLLIGSLMADTTSTYTNPDKTIYASSPKVVINLQSMVGSTGYQWRWAPTAVELNAITQVSHHIIAGKHAKGMIGAPSTAQWVFTLSKKIMQAPTQITIHMTLSQIWMKHGPYQQQQTFVINTIPKWQ